MLSTPNPSQSQISVSDGFALMLETACLHFEVMQRLIRQETRLICANGQEDVTGRCHAQMALAKSFLFHVVRARRICEHGAGALTLDRESRRKFLKDTEGVLAVRDVNEHGFDAGGGARGKSSKPSMHYRSKDDAHVDETSMMVLGEQRILIGPLNLYDVYGPTNTMRLIAGFSSLVSQ